VLVFAVAGGVLAIFHRVRLPAVAGLILAGVAIGPHGIGILQDRAGIDRLAEIGILLLMFSIGLDFAPDRLAELRRAARLGFFQILICVAVTALAVVGFVGHWTEAVLLGCVVAHTSSSFMLKLLLDRGELGAPQARLGVGISLTQDLSVVPMLLAVPLLAGDDRASLAGLGLATLKVAGVLVVALGLTRWVVPFWLHHVVHSRSRELFLLFLVVACLGTAWATAAVGLSGALGAFLAGLAIAASRYVYQTLAEVVPFRDLLVSLFFISMGALVDPSIAGRHALAGLTVVAAVLALKFVSGLLPTLAARYPLRIAVAVGAGLAQVGEFGFVLAHAGKEAGLISDALFQFIVVAAIGTLLANPLIVARVDAIARLFAALSGGRPAEPVGAGARKGDPERENHVIVAGYGLNGRTLVQALRACNVPCVALDLDPVAVASARRAGEPLEWGDCTRVDVLESASLGSARLFVVAISDPWATRQAVQVARHANPGLHIVARTKHQAEIEPLRGLGANEVIAEEFETCLEILARVLHSYDLPRLRIEEVVDGLRGDSYDAIRGPMRAAPGRAVLGEELPSLKIETLNVSENSPAGDRTLRDLDVRARTGATLLAVRRAGEVQTMPAADFRFQVGDAVILAGTPREILAAARLLEPESNEVPRVDPRSEH